MVATAKKSSSDLVQCVDTTTIQMQQIFKGITIREANFRRQKMARIEHQLLALQHHPEEDSGQARGEVRPVSRAKKEDPSPATPSLNRSQSMPSFQEKARPTLPFTAGMSRNRLQASFPTSSHPAVHPGALAERPHQVQFPSQPVILTPIAWAADQATSHQPPPSGQKPGSAASMLAPSGRRVKVPNQSPVVGRKAEVAKEPLDSPFAYPSKEEELFLHMEKESAHLAATSGKGREHPQDPPGTLSRFGHLITLLGPRYKTVPRDALWQLAVEGGYTMIERRLKKAASYQSLRRPAAVKSGESDVEMYMGLDSEGEARASWLAHQRRARNAELAELALAEGLG